MKPDRPMQNLRSTNYFLNQMKKLWGLTIRMKTLWQNLFFAYCAIISYRKSSIKPPGGLFFSSTFEGGA